MKKSTIALIVLIVLAILGIIGVWLTQSEKSLALVKEPFKQLPGWQDTDLSRSLKTFQISCKTLLRQNPDQSAGSATIPMKVKDWQPACQAAMAIKDVTPQKARNYFQVWFIPASFYIDKPLTGLFTGYYMPLFQARLEKTEQFNVPLFGMPKNLVVVNLQDFDSSLPNKRVFGHVQNQQLVPYYTRKEINQGAIDQHAPVLAWLKSPIDRLYLEIQGSGVLKLPSGKLLYVGYAAQNGAPYTAIGKVLADKGHLQAEQISMQSIRSFLESNPEQINDILNHNQSFVFFTRLKQDAALGAQGVPLTPGYSLAVDRKYIPLGLPLWLSTTRPAHAQQEGKKLQRLMIAQDTGGAIKGAVRGDVYWGPGEKAEEIAGHMKNRGRYWLLLPRQTPDSPK